MFNFVLYKLTSSMHRPRELIIWITLHLKMFILSLPFKNKEKIKCCLPPIRLPFPRPSPFKNKRFQISVSFSESNKLTFRCLTRLYRHFLFETWTKGILIWSNFYNLPIIFLNLNLPFKTDTQLEIKLMDQFRTSTPPCRGPLWLHNTTVLEFFQKIFYSLWKF